MLECKNNNDTFKTVNVFAFKIIYKVYKAEQTNFTLI